MPEDKDRTQNDAIVEALRQIGLAPSGGGGKPKLPADRVLELFQAAVAQGLAAQKSMPEVPAPPVVDNVAEADAYIQPNDDADDPVEAAMNARYAAKQSEWEVGLQGTARDAFNDYILQNVSKDAPAGSEIAVDGAFIKDHGVALFGSVLQALVQSVVPPELTVEVPPKKSEDAASGDAPVVEAAAAEPQVKLKVDFARILADLVANARKKPAEDSEPS